MFNFKQFNYFLYRIGEGEVDLDRASEILYEDYLTNKDFAGALFNPPDGNNLTEYAVKMYKTTKKDKVKKVIINTIKDYGVEKFDRWVAVWLYSIASFNLNGANEAYEKTEKEFSEGKFDRREKEEQLENIDRHLELTKKLNKYANKIVKSDAKDLARKTGLPKDICVLTYKTNPNPRYINNNRIGFYMNELLNNIYSELDEDDVTVDVKGINWKKFFSEVYGRENLLDCATFILLEGAHRGKGFRKQDVLAIWDSLTSFALDALEHAEAPTRIQMIELYLKRVATMFANNKGPYDLRVDLRHLDEDRFPKLVDALKKYNDRINTVFSTPKTENA